jgi:hypothetical protein
MGLASPYPEEIYTGLQLSVIRPTTGKIVRLHQTLQRELLDVHGPVESIAALQAALDAWREE